MRDVVFQLSVAGLMVGFALAAGCGDEPDADRADSGLDSEDARVRRSDAGATSAPRVGDSDGGAVDSGSDSGTTPDAAGRFDGGAADRGSDSGTTPDAAGRSDAATGGYTLTGTVRGTVPDGTQIAVVWKVVSGSPDYAFLEGEGTTVGSNFTLRLADPPPTDALNEAGDGRYVGVGQLILLPPTFAVPRGRLSRSHLASVNSAAIGGSAAGYGIIWRQGPDAGWWSDSFSEGHSCGTCVPMTGGLDEWAPVDCGEVVVADLATLYSLILSGPGICNWS